MVIPILPKFERRNTCEGLTYYVEAPIRGSVLTKKQFAGRYQLHRPPRRVRMDERLNRAQPFETHCRSLLRKRRKTPRRPRALRPPVAQPPARAAAAHASDDETASAAAGGLVAFLNAIGKE